MKEGILKTLSCPPPPRRLWYADVKKRQKRFLSFHSSMKTKEYLGLIVLKNSNRFAPMYNYGYFFLFSKKKQKYGLDDVPIFHLSHPSHLFPSDFHDAFGLESHPRGPDLGLLLSLFCSLEGGGVKRRKFRWRQFACDIWIGKQKREAKPWENTKERNKTLWDNTKYHTVTKKKGGGGEFGKTKAQINFVGVKLKFLTKPRR